MAKFKVGDILVHKRYDHNVKILAIGKTSYFYEYIEPGKVMFETADLILTTENDFDLKSKEINITESDVRLTKREHFTAMAMQGMLSNPALTMPDPTTGFPICYEICYAAVHYTDRLMEELDKEI